MARSSGLMLSRIHFDLACADKKLHSLRTGAIAESIRAEPSRFGFEAASEARDCPTPLLIRSRVGFVKLLT